MDCVYQITLNQKLPHIIYAKQHYTKHYRVNSKSGVNFQVMLKQNRAKRNHIKEMRLYCILTLHTHTLSLLLEFAVLECLCM
jgi:hypothetical protein